MSNNQSLNQVPSSPQALQNLRQPQPELLTPEQSTTSQTELPNSQNPETQTANQTPQKEEMKMSLQSAEQIANSIQQILDSFTTTPGLMQKLKSRKFWLAVAGLFIGICGILGWVITRMQLPSSPHCRSSQSSSTVCLKARSMPSVSRLWAMQSKTYPRH